MGKFWGENITATIDWCEDNYSITEYVVEFWNSTSSLIISLFAVIAVLHGLKHKIEPRFFLWYFGFFLVGLGSAAFHGTLLFEYQMWDELPMMWATFSWLYIVWEIGAPAGKTNVPLAVGMSIYALVVTIVHIFSGFVLVFQAHFILLMLIGQGTVIFWTRTRPHLEAKKLLPAYFGSIAIASAGWLIDHFLCDHINTYLPLNPQLHSLWHVMMGLHCYVAALWTLIYRTESLGRGPHLIYLFGVFPWVEFGDDARASRKSKKNN